MSDEASGRTGSVARTVVRVFFTSAFLSVLGGGLFAVHLINKKLAASPTHAYVPATSASRVNSLAADALRSKTQKWNMYRADAGFSVVAPASFTIAFPRPSADEYLTDTRPEGRAIVRAVKLGEHMGSVPYTEWARGATVTDMNAVLPVHLGKVENLHPDTFVAGWFNYDREDDKGYLHCVTSPALLTNVPVAIEACSTYGLEYDSALLNVSLPTAAASQKSVDFMDPAGEQALNQAFVEHPPAAPPEPSLPKKDSAKKGHGKDAAAPDAASALTVIQAPKLSPREVWEQTRSVHCYGKSIADMEACYATEALNEIQELQDGSNSDNVLDKATSAADHPGVDVMAPGDDSGDASVSPDAKDNKGDSGDDQ
jgi:hypothetical protein